MTIFAQISAVVFLILLTLSTIISTIDKQRSFEVLLSWCIGVLVFLFFSILKIKFSTFAKILFILTLTCISLYILYLFQPHYFVFLNHNPYQFIIPTVAGHNHLGDLIGLTLTLTFITKTSFLSHYDILLFYIVMIVSFSKSSFLAMGSTYALTLLNKKTSLMYGVILLLITISVLLVYTKEFDVYPPIQRIQKEFSTLTKLQPKPLLSSRELYTQQAYTSWKQADFPTQVFGYGLGNFFYPSQKTATKLDLGAPDAHNIFLSLFIEAGLLPTLWFLIFFLFVFIGGLITQSLSLYPLLYLFVLFQTDYTFHIPFFFVCFFIFAGQSLMGKHEMQNKKIVMILIGISFVITAFSAYMHNDLANQKTRLLISLDTQIKKQDKPALFKTIETLEQIQPYNQSFLIRSSSIYEAFDAHENAVRLLEKLSVYSPREFIIQFPHILELQGKSGVDLKQYIQRNKNEFIQLPLTLYEQKKFNETCIKFAEIPCIKK